MTTKTVLHKWHPRPRSRARLWVTSLPRVRPSRHVCVGFCLRWPSKRRVLLLVSCPICDVVVVAPASLSVLARSSNEVAELLRKVRSPCACSVGWSWGGSVVLALSLSSLSLLLLLLLIIGRALLAIAASGVPHHVHGHAVGDARSHAHPVPQCRPHSRAQLPSIPAPQAVLCKVTSLLGQRAGLFIDGSTSGR